MRIETERPTEKACHLITADVFSWAVEARTTAKCDTRGGNAVDVVLMNVSTVIYEKILRWVRQRAICSCQEARHLVAWHSELGSIRAIGKPKRYPRVSDLIDRSFMNRACVIREPILRGRRQVECPGQERGHLCPADVVRRAIKARGTSLSHAGKRDRFDHAFVNVAIVISERAAARGKVLGQGGRDHQATGDDKQSDQTDKRPHTPV